MSTTALTPTRPRFKSRARKFSAFLLTLILAVAGLVTFTNESHAAGPGTGWGVWGDNIFGFHGSFTTGNGEHIYCIQPGVPLPTNGTTDNGLVGNVNWLSGNLLAGMNAVVSKYGQTGDRDQAAAVDFAIKFAADFNGTLYSSNYDGRYGNDINGHIRWRMSRFVAQGANLANIQSMANAYYSEIHNTTASAGGSGSGQFTFQVDHLNNYFGTLTVSVSPGNASGTVTLTNGYFRDTGSSTRGGVSNGQVLPIVGVPPEGGAAGYKIAASGNFTAPGSGYEANVRLYTTPGQQTSIGRGSMSRTAFSFNGEDPTLRSGQFLPNLSTSALSYVQEGQSFTDSVTFYTVADDEGTMNEWPRTTQGNYFPVVAQGTLYGPFESQPTEEATPPADAPVAATASVTTTGAQGPTAPYSVSTGTARTSGYYTWVWEIHQDRQNPIVQGYIPAGYSFADRFGLTAETSIVPMKPVAFSSVLEAWAEPGDRVVDTLTVSNSNGFWLEGTTARFDGTAYGVPNGAVPTVSNTVPSNAVVLGTQSLIYTGPGTQTSRPVTVPTNVGSVVWVWRFVGATQAEPNHFAAGYTWADQFGLVNETTRIRMSPILSTEVVEKYADGAFNDQVTLSMAQGRYISGAVVEAYGTLYGPITDRPTESAEVPDGTPVAHRTTLTFTGEGTRTTDTDFIPELAGHYTWVWRIASSEQSAATQGFLPEGYIFTDRFGIDAETSVKSLQIGGESAVTKSEIILGEETVDTLNIWVENGAWLQRDGQNIPVTFRGSSYFVPGDIAPTQSAEVPEGAELVQTVFMDITEPGLHTMPAAAGEEHRKGFRTWVWEVLDEDQAEDLRGMTEFWADEFGMPAETQNILVPTVRTESQAGARLGGTIQDTAFVTGSLPLRGAELTFEAYAIPMVKNEAGKWVIDYPVDEEPIDGPTEELPTAEPTTTPTPTPTPSATPTPTPSAEEEAEDWSWVVKPENLIGSNLDQGEIITEPGEYLSPKYTVNSYQKVLWVESLWTVDPALSAEPVEPVEGEEPIEAEEPIEGEEPEEVPAYERLLIHRGVVGIPNETTFVLDVKTYAMSDTGARNGVEHGISTWDTAELTGYVPEGGTLEFEAYIVPVNTSGPVEDSCTPERLAWTSAPIDLEGGLYLADSPLALTGESHVFNPDVDSALYWVAVVKDELDREVNRGLCGDPDETIGLKGQKLLSTGASLALGGAALGLVVLSGLAFAMAARRRRIAD